VKTVSTCPFGSDCEKVVGDHIERCALYLELEGQDPQSGVPVRESRCSFTWAPLLQIQGNGIALGGNASIQSLRNETVKRQDIAIKGMKLVNGE